MHQGNGGFGKEAHRHQPEGGAWAREPARRTAVCHRIRQRPLSERGGEQESGASVSPVLAEPQRRDLEPQLLLHPHATARDNSLPKARFYGVMAHPENEGSRQHEKKRERSPLVLQMESKTERGWSSEGTDVPLAPGWGHRTIRHLTEESETSASPNRPGEKGHSRVEMSRRLVFVP